MKATDGNIHSSIADIYVGNLNYREQTRYPKGSLGTAVAAIHYKNVKPDALLVGLDTQLAQEWLSDREDGKLPDLIGIGFDDAGNAYLDLIEVKTYSDSPRSFTLLDHEHGPEHYLEKKQR